MLSIPAEFPHVGAPAFVRHTAEAVRILRRHADGTALVAFTARHPAARVASDNRTLPLDDLFATAAEAIGLPRRAARRPRRMAR